MKPFLVTAVFLAAAAGYGVRAIHGRAAGEVLHALMCLGMVVMALMPATAHGMGPLGEALAVIFFLGAVWALVIRAPAACLMAFGMALTFTPVE